MQILRATYRLQFNEHFRLRDALALVPYFHEVGISHIYSSPLFKARAHSVHGYDVCDLTQINPEIGTEDDLETLANALHERQMGLILDVVPNHMGIGTPENFWWWDVLKNGRASKFADCFDINWESSDEKLRGKILVPILGDDYEKVLERGELKIESANDEWILTYFENQFPLSLNTLNRRLHGFQKTESAKCAVNLNRAELDEVIQKQNYRLAHWRDGDEKLNYRRFFAVSTLAAVRVEDKKVFNETHALLKKWLDKSWLDGLRVDHPDGLRNPKEYLDRLRALAPDKWIVVEKILQPQEELPDDWPIQGTVGYDFLNQLNGLFIESRNAKVLTNFYSEFTGEPTGTNELVQEKKRLVLQTLFTTEVRRLVEMLIKIAPRHSIQKFSREQFCEALIEFAASFSVYRTYVRANENFVGKNDFHFIKQAGMKAKNLRPDLSPEHFDFLSALMLLQFRGELESEFVARFQQLTSPAMAKGVEDTAFYCLNWFSSINEVGGDPGKFGVSAKEFHEFCQRQNARWPHSMLCSSTHDTKRSEDVRARMNLLSEIPDEWRETVLRWSKMNERHRKSNFPDRNMEYLFYQTLVGAWPISLARILTYMEKASCEAKQHTDWNNRNKNYDDALKNFVTTTLADKNFTDDLEKFISLLTEAAQINSLAQTLIKLTAPGVPDIYQGNEIWDFSLVDPDNRRAVNFEIRKKLLANTKILSAEEIWKRRDEGLPKLWLIQKSLAVRARHENWFRENYEPLFAHGDKSNHVVAYARGGAITIVPRFWLQLKEDWKNTTLKLPRGNWRNEFAEENFSGEIAAAGLFRKFPVTLLVKE
jgi:(1->4)-alpha-D-glucan 1-alpha-D-glucosylmutase